MRAVIAAGPLLKPCRGIFSRNPEVLGGWAGFVYSSIRILQGGDYER